MKQVISDLEKLRDYLGKFIPLENNTIVLTERQRNYIVELIDKVLGENKDGK